MWRVVQVSFNITPHVNIAHMFVGWLNGINKKIMYKILVGASALCWAIWLSRNDIAFNNTRVVTPMQVIFWGTYWIRFWALLQKRTSGLTLFGGVMCLRPLRWRSLHLIDGLSTIELILCDVWHCSRDRSFFFFWPLCMYLKNRYIHSFMQRLEYWKYIKKSHGSILFRRAISRSIMRLSGSMDLFSGGEREVDDDDVGDQARGENRWWCVCQWVRPRALDFSSLRVVLHFFPLLKKCRLLVCVQFVPDDFLLFYYLVVGKRPEIDAETMTWVAKWTEI
jgi:hypothetical protein